MQSSAMGSSCFVHSPFLPLNPCSSSSFSRPLVLSLRNAGRQRKIRAPLMASLQPKSPPESCSAQRRVLIFLGVSVLPFLKWNQKDSVGLAAGEDVERTKAGSDEQALQRPPPPNPFLSLINAIGTLGSGILAALYAIARKDKIALEEKIQSLTNELKQKDVTIVSMEKNFESKLLQEQEEGKKKLSQIKDEQLMLMNQLNSANSTIAEIERMLKDEKAKIKDLEHQVDSLRSQLSQSEKDKLSLDVKLKEKNESISSLQDRISLLSSEIKDKEEAIQTLKSSLDCKDADLKKMDAEYGGVKDELAQMKVENTDLKDEIVKLSDQLNQKNVMVNDLNARLDYLVAERDEVRKSYDAVLKKYDELKTTSREKAAFDANLLEKKEREKNQLEEKYEQLTVQANEYQALISNLTRERDELAKSLDLEATNVNGLKQELGLAREELGKSRSEASEFTKQLTLLRSSNSEIESELSRVQTEFTEMRNSLTEAIEEERIRFNELASELNLVKAILESTKIELDATRDELKASVEKRESLQNELIEVHQKADVAARTLQEEKTMTASLSSQVKLLDKQITEDRESRKTLESDLDEATKALDGMNQNAMLISREVEMERARIGHLEGEKEALRSELGDRVNSLTEARENLEDAQEVIMRLGGERENLERKVKGLEKELAASKSEILKLKAMVNSPPAMVSEGAEVGPRPVATGVKRGGRRRKAEPE